LPAALALGRAPLAMSIPQARDRGAAAVQLRRDARIGTDRHKYGAIAMYGRVADIVNNS
jgi:hypothetical protein